MGILRISKLFGLWITTLVDQLRIAIRDQVRKKVKAKLCYFEIIDLLNRPSLESP